MDGKQAGDEQPADDELMQMFAEVGQFIERIADWFDAPRRLRDLLRKAVPVLESAGAYELVDKINDELARE